MLQVQADFAALATAELALALLLHVTQVSDVWPVPVLYLPATQSVHLVWAVAALYLPATQSTQALIAEAEAVVLYLPATQACTHSTQNQYPSLIPIHSAPRLS